jgi:hypothetical protein
VGDGPFDHPPGLDGSYHGSCVVCGRGTDTLVAFRGSAEWCIAGLILLGVPESQAIGTFQVGLGNDPRSMSRPPGDLTIRYLVCQTCAARTPFANALALIGSQTVRVIPEPSD